MATLNLVVLHGVDLEQSRLFYESLLGVTLTAEQHDRGPVHFSAVLGDVVLELYPRRHQRGDTATSSTPPTPVTIGFCVPAIAEALQRLKAAGFAVPTGETAAKSEAGRVRLSDPDGHRLFLTE